MFKAKQRITSMFVAFCTFLVTAILAISMIAVPTNSVTASAADNGAWTLVKDVDTLAVGDTIIIVANKSNFALSTTQNSNNRGQAAVTKSGDTLTVTSAVQEIKLVEGSVSGTYAFMVGEQYLYCASTSSKNYLRTQKTLDAKASWDISITSAGVATVKSKVSGISRNQLMYNSQSSCFACYSSGQGAISIYEWITTGGESACQHENTKEVKVDATCTVDGSITITCNDCGETVSTKKIQASHSYELTGTTDATCAQKGEKTYECSVCGDGKTEEIPMLPHNYENGKCVACGEKQPSEVTITFNDVAKRTEYSTSKQVWEENGITVTNDKASSTSNVGDYANPARFYKSSKVTIAYPKMVKIAFSCNNSDYATDLQKTIGATATASGNVVTVIFAEEKDSFEITLSVAKIFVDSITVYVAAPEEPAEPEVPAETKIDSASLTLGDEITLNYYVVMVEEEHKKATMHFTVKFSGNSNGNDQTYDVEGVAQEDGRYVYSLALAPQLMTTIINAELKLGDETLASKEGYSIVEYAKDTLKNTNSDKVKRLVSDLLYYGAAAQQHTGYDTDHLATVGVEGILSAVEEEFENNDFKLETNEEVSSYPVWFAGAGVEFSNVNKIFVQLNLLDDATLDNVSLTATDAKGDKVALEVVGNKVYTDAIFATGFADTYTFVLSYDGVVMQTLTYSVNAYAYAMRNNTSAMGALALALYNYGVSAAAYNA